FPRKRAQAPPIRSIRTPAKAGAHLPAAQPPNGGSRPSPGRAILSGLRGVIRKDDGRDEGPALDERGLRRLSPECLHRAEPAEPVQLLVLSRLLDLAGRVAVPGGVVAGFERVVKPPVGLDIGPQLPVLLGQERMRPARRCHKSRPPRALR